MKPENWPRIKDLMAQALVLPTDERARLLADETDPAIRSEVEGLLAAHSDSDGFMDSILPNRPGIRDSIGPGEIIDGYRIVEKIAEGGMGSVYLAENSGDDFSQRVALKLIKRGMDTNAVLKRFLLERRILAQLEHPMIARMIDGGSTESGLPYFVMEYVEGRSIKQFCEENRYSITARLELFLKVCEAVTYAHKNLVVHRDIKPSNIIVTADGSPKLLDFGIAKLLAPNWDESTAEATATNFRLMTPEYASPEQLRGKMTTTSTDVYSLGVVLYELLTGARPFDFKGKSPIEIAEEILTHEPRLPSLSAATILQRGATRENEPAPRIRDNRALRGDLDNIILKAMRKEPEERYGSVREMANDIERFLSGLPVTAMSDTRLYRIRKFVGRHRSGVVTAAAVAILMVFSTAVTMRQYVIAQCERAKAEDRFRQLRSVAKSLLNETNESLAKLPEGLEIRGNLIAKSVSVLDSIAAEETDDVDLLTEIADAYQTIGRYRNWNTRDSVNAVADLKKALALRQRVVELAPERIEFRTKLNATIGNLIDAYGLDHDTPKLIEALEMMIASVLSQIEREPDNPEYHLTLSENLEAVSDHLSITGRVTEASERLTESAAAADRAIALLDSDAAPDSRRSLKIAVLMHLASIRQRSNRADEALALLTRAAAIADSAYADDRSNGFAFNSSVRIRRIKADIYSGGGDWAKALEMYEVCLERLSRNRDNKNLDARTIQSGYAVYQMRRGVALDKVGRRSEGSAALESGLKLFFSYLDANKKDPEALAFMPEMFEIPSSFFLSRGDRKRAANVWEACVDRMLPFLVASPGDGGFSQRTSDCYRRQADVLADFREASGTFGVVAQSDLTRARELYRRALESIKSSNVKSPIFESRVAELETRIGKIRELANSGSK